MAADQKGFSLVELAIIIFGLGLLTFSGWYIYDHRKTADSIYKSPANSGSVLTTPTKKNVTTKQITIKEAGIEFGVPVTLKNLTYKVIDTSSSSVTIYLSTKELDAAEQGLCDVSNASFGSTPPLGVLTKVMGQSAGSSDTGGFIKQFADFYITYLPASQGCFNMSSNNETALNLASQLSRAVRSSVLAK